MKLSPLILQLTFGMGATDADYNTTGPTEDPGEKDPNQPSLKASIINTAFGVSLTTLICLAQILVFYVVSQDVQLRHPNNYFMTSLAVADLLIGVFVVPLWTAQAALGYWPFGEQLCSVWNIADYSLCAVSINTICYIATDRYLCLAFPLYYPAKRSPFVAKVTLAVVWCISILFHSLLIGMTQQTYVDDWDGLHCQAYYSDAIPITIFVTSSLLWIPMAYTYVMYILVFRITRRVISAVPPLPQHLPTVSRNLCSENMNNGSRTNYTNRSPQPSFSSDGTDIGVTGFKVKFKRSLLKSQVKAVRTIGLLLVTFTFCWSPVGVALLITAVDAGSGVPWMVVAGYWLAYLNSLLNPVCYTYGNQQFRAILRRKICRRPSVV